ncbi:MAG: methylated-DNA--[protein]-cysteine S-methyltransferase [Sulfuritalea sp.]|nr:methylated-DNA--[protein]-cysteine S-methyltransferase [Sulfuritalea sp.]
MTKPPYAAVLLAPSHGDTVPGASAGDITFSIGIRCNADEITEIAYLEPQPEVKPTVPLAQEAVRQLRAWLKDPNFEFGLPLAPAGTHFQRKVWEQVAAIPAGQTMSYGEVATAIRSGPRAVGNACGANPYPIVVPCHRVVAANQGLGGFGRQGEGFLLDIKRWLLLHERS